MALPPYVQGDDLPDLTLTLEDSAGNLYQFATGWTFSLKVGVPGAAAQFTKSSGITGANTAPNVTVQWATSGELNSIAAGTWQLMLFATRTSDSKRHSWTLTLPIKPAIT